jgi:hypothetical protein
MKLKVQNDYVLIFRPVLCHSTYIRVNLLKSANSLMCKWITILSFTYS